MMRSELGGESMSTIKAKIGRHSGISVRSKHASRWSSDMNGRQARMMPDIKTNWDDQTEEELRAWASQYVGWATNEMADPDDLAWRIERQFPLSDFQSMQIDWHDYYKDDVLQNPRYDEEFIEADWDNPIVLSLENDKIILWDGYHRIATSIARGDECIMALVGTPFEIEEMKPMDLEEFIESPLRNQWINEKGITYYVRKCVIRQGVIILASCTSDETHVGALWRFLRRHKDKPFYMEQVINPELAEYMRRIGWFEENNGGVPQFVSPAAQKVLEEQGWRVGEVGGERRYLHPRTLQMMGKA